MDALERARRGEKVSAKEIIAEVFDALATAALETGDAGFAKVLAQVAAEAQRQHVNDMLEALGTKRRSWIQQVAIDTFAPDTVWPMWVDDEDDYG